MSDEIQLPDAPKPTRADIARANGAKSKGPITPRGKAISSRNATRHGLTSRQIVLPDESADSYLALHRAFVDQFHPQTIVELELVSTMAIARWRLRRLVSVETNYLAHEVHSRRQDIQRFVDNPNREKSIAWTFSRVSGGTALSLMTRYETAQHRIFERALKQFQSLREGSNTSISNRTEQPNPSA